MAVSLYFGLPGCGKTTMLAKLALDGLQCARYKNVYSNVALNMPGVCIIDNSVIGQYELRDCLLLIDEATLFADSRDYKNFAKGRLSYFLEHRHRNADIILFTQQWDGVDRKIRVITDRVYYVKKGLLFGRWISTVYRIPYDIIIPDPKKNNGEKLGEIVQGYCKPPFLVRLFARRVYRPKYYQYFDSWELKELPPLPSAYKPIAAERKPILRPWFNKTFILLRSESPKINRPRSGLSEPLRCPLGPAPSGRASAIMLTRIKIMVLFRYPRCFHLHLTVSYHCRTQLLKLTPIRYTAQFPTLDRY